MSLINSSGSLDSLLIRFSFAKMPKSKEGPNSTVKSLAEKLIIPPASSNFEEDGAYCFGLVCLYVMLSWSKIPWKLFELVSLLGMVSRSPD